MHTSLLDPSPGAHPNGRVTVVLGASPNPWRYAHLAVERLREHGHAVVAIGSHTGTIGEIPILATLPAGQEVDTVTLYLNEQNQADWEEAILNWHPRRIIFNPGAENERLSARAAAQGIEVVEGCTLVMLALGRY